jgi:hypothetical protein
MDGEDERTIVRPSDRARARTTFGTGKEEESPATGQRSATERQRQTERDRPETARDSDNPSQNIFGSDERREEKQLRPGSVTR